MVVYNNIIPFRGVAAVNLFGILFVRNGVVLTDRMLNHERIHTRQMREMLYLFFYLWYLVEWLIRLPFHWIGKGAYYLIAFEREAYENEFDLNYLSKRKLFAWFKFL